MYKKLLVYIFIFVLSISIVFGNSTEAFKPETAVNIAFAESEAKLDYININSYVIIKNEFIPIDNASKICNDVSEKLGMKEISVKRENDKNFCLISINGIIHEGVYGTIILQSSKLKEFKESTIVIDIIETREQYDLEKLCDKIRDVLMNYGEVNLNVNLAGYYVGFKDKKELQRKINNVFKRIGAKEVEGIDDRELISVTGYTPNIQDYISYCGKKANINIATRFNSYENKTNIWIGSPLIVLEY